MQIGDINVIDSILNLEKRIITLQKVLLYIASENPTVKFPSTKQIEGFNDEAVKEIIKKYPNMDIKKK